jgi:hypothetical protein
MAFYAIVVVAVGILGAWFVRTPLFRAHLHGHGKDPGIENSRAEGRYPSNGGGYDYGMKPPRTP